MATNVAIGAIGINGSNPMALLVPIMPNKSENSQKI
jgi:hypothetical protein